MTDELTGIENPLFKMPYWLVLGLDASKQLLTGVVFKMDCLVPKAQRDQQLSATGLKATTMQLVSIVFKLVFMCLSVNNTWSDIRAISHMTVTSWYDGVFKALLLFVISPNASGTTAILTVIFLNRCISSTLQEKRDSGKPLRVVQYYLTYVYMWCYLPYMVAAIIMIPFTLLGILFVLIMPFSGTVYFIIFSQHEADDIRVLICKTYPFMMLFVSFVVAKVVTILLIWIHPGEWSQRTFEKGRFFKTMWIAVGAPTYYQYTAIFGMRVLEGGNIVNAFLRTILERRSNGYFPHLAENAGSVEAKLLLLWLAL